MKFDFYIFTDGSSLGNPGPGGFGGVVYLAKEDLVFEVGDKIEETTNNKMELQAIIESLRKIEGKPGSVAVYSDSKYSVSGLNDWLKGWKKRDWKKADGQDVLNKEFWQELDRLKEDRKEKIQAFYVPGHSEVLGNERAHEIAFGLANNSNIELFEGKLDDYPEKSFLLDIKSGFDPKPQKPYFVVIDKDGEVKNFDNWNECQKYVSGNSGVKFKKVKNKKEEEEFKKQILD